MTYNPVGSAQASDVAAASSSSAGAGAGMGSSSASRARRRDSAVRGGRPTATSDRPKAHRVEKKAAAGGGSTFHKQKPSKARGAHDQGGRPEGDEREGKDSQAPEGAEHLRADDLPTAEGRGDQAHPGVARPLESRRLGPIRRGDQHRDEREEPRHELDETVELP